METVPVTFETVSTDQLHEGDVIWDHGMRLRLGARDVYPGRPYGDVYAFDGEVLNRADVDAAGVVPASFLVQYARDGRTVEDRNTWRVQGNSHARWQREVQ